MSVFQMEKMISTILPEWVYATEVFGIDQEVLFDEEAHLMASSIPERRAEFLTGRKCAHDALSKLGGASQPILRGPNREPLWPEGVVGSITHCGDYCAAAVARSHGERWIGIDAELNQPLPQGIIDIIASPSEIEQAAGALRRIPNWDRLVFSAKESVYKAWYPCRQMRFDALDYSITFLPESSCFEVSFSSADFNGDKAGARFYGRYLVGSDLILTSVVVTRESASDLSSN
jgi:4'-phosphopantetheinyl transferase EntD